MKLPIKADLYIILGIMFIFGLILVLGLVIVRNNSFWICWNEIGAKMLEILTTAMPPALILSLTMGTKRSIDILKSKNIVAINPEKINEAGWIKHVCFDKTGTLTE